MKLLLVVQLGMITEAACERHINPSIAMTTRSLITDKTRDCLLLLLHRPHRHLLPFLRVPNQLSSDLRHRSVHHYSHTLLRIALALTTPVLLQRDNDQPFL